jgi:hypothetical protein
VARTLLPRVPLMEDADLVGRTIRAESMLESERLANELLVENFEQTQFMLEDRGWTPLGGSEADLSAKGRERARALCRFMAATHPLIKRGLMLREAYVWGLGVSVTVKATDDDGQGQDVNQVVQDWLETNRESFTGSQARGQLEHALGTDGEVFLAAITDRVSGTVEMQTFPAGEIVDILTDPDNKKRPWYYLRSYSARELMPDGEVRDVEKHVAYPALGHRLRAHPAQIRVGSQAYAMQADTYVKHVAVNQLPDTLRGIGDAFASLPWARAHKEFLEQWALLMAALSRYAWRQKAPAGRARNAALEAKAAADRGGVGATKVLSEGHDLEAIPKTGATIDAESGKPLAAYVAAGMGVPVTMLLGDPGITGARATAETLSEPQRLEMGLRRRLWAETIDALAQHVIDSAVIAPQGPLSGRQRVDPRTSRIVVELPDDDDRTVAVDFPDYENVDVSVIAKALSDATAADVPLPPLVKARIVLQAFGLEDIDEILADMVDDNGDFIPQSDPAGAAAIAQARRDLVPDPGLPVTPAAAPAAAPAT